MRATQTPSTIPPKAVNHEMSVVTPTGRTPVRAIGNARWMPTPNATPAREPRRANTAAWSRYAPKSVSWRAPRQRRTATVTTFSRTYT